MVVADVDFVSNRLLVDAVVRSSVNEDFFLNAINWMAERTENIGIAAKERERRTATITPSRRRRLLFGTVFGPVIVMVVLGIYVWRVRSQ